MAQLRCSKVIPFPREKVFELLTDPYHVPVLLEDKVDVEIMGGATQLEKGSEYSFIMTRFGVSQRIRWEVIEFVKGSRITYSQVEGVFPKWEHTSFFEDFHKGETKVIDKVDYQLPFGVLGLFLNDLIVRKELQKLLNIRIDKASKVLREHNTSRN